MTTQQATSTAGEELGATFERHRREIHVHCYRMTGSYSDAEDLTQETFLRAWRCRDDFRGRSSVRTWLFRIATNACLDFLKHHGRRSRPSGSLIDTLEQDPAIEPFLDVVGVASRMPGDPADELVESETTGLMLVAALLHLPPRQRAAVIARDLVGFSLPETVDLLDGTPSSVNSLLQRARATMRSQRAERSAERAAEPEDAAILARYVEAHHRADVDALVRLIAADVRIGMPPEAPRHGVDEAHQFFRHILSEHDTGRWRLIPSRANGALCTINYLRRPGEATFRATSVDVLAIRDGQIESISCFLGERIFTAFGLPLVTT